MRRVCEMFFFPKGPKDRKNIPIIVCFIILKYMRTYYYKYPYFKKNLIPISYLQNVQYTNTVLERGGNHQILHSYSCKR